MGTFTANLNLYKPDIGEYGWGALVDANWDVLDNITAGMRGATKIIATNDSIDKTKADYICDGTNDEVQLQEALDSFAGGGLIQCMEGNYNFGASIIGRNDVTIAGLFSNGWPGSPYNATGTVFNLVANVTMFDMTHKSGWAFKNILFNGNSRANYPIITALGDATLCGHFAIRNSAFQNAIPALRFTQAYDIWLEMCKFDTCGNSSYGGVEIHTGSTDSSNNIRFLACHWEQLPGIGIKLISDHGGIPIYSLYVDDCKFEGGVSSNRAVSIYGPLDSSVICNNVFLRSLTNIIELTLGGRNRIHNNWLQDHTGYAISTNGAYNQITSNNMYSTFCTGDIETKSSGWFCKIIGNSGSATNADTIIADSGTGTMNVHNGENATDDHTSYAFLGGRSGGQVLKGGTAVAESLTLQSTSNASRGRIINNDATNFLKQIEFENTYGIWWKNAAGTPKHMIVLDASDHLIVGYELATGCLYINADGTSRQVTLGTNDSGGSGYRYMRVPNA